MAKLLSLLLLSFTVCLQANVNVLAISGSTRDDSVNKKLLMEAVQVARELRAAVTVVDLKDYPMPFYDGDLESKEGMPQSAAKLQRLMAESQVIFIASPEYNSSLPAVLKNCLDWVSRAKMHQLPGDAFKGKKFVLLSASPSGKGGASGLVHLRTILEALGGTVIEDQLSLPNAYSAFDSQGNLKDEKAKKELKKLVQQALK